MPLLKSISGHTSCKGAYCHLTKDGQALAANYLNLDAPEQKKDQAGNEIPAWSLQRRMFKYVYF